MSNGDLIGLIALLIAVVLGVSWVFQQQGEARIANLRLLRRDVRGSLRALEQAVQALEEAQQLSSATLSCLVRSLDIVVVYIESNGGVMAELIDPVANDFPGYVEQHRALVDELRQAVVELRVLSPDADLRMSAAKTLAFGRQNLRALEAVRVAIGLYPDDQQLQSFEADLRAHVLRG